MNLKKDANLLKTDHTFIRKKTINIVHLITVSRRCDRDPHPFVLLFNYQLPQVWKLQYFLYYSAVIALTFTWTILFPKTSDLLCVQRQFGRQYTAHLNHRIMESSR